MTAPAELDLDALAGAVVRAAEGRPRIVVGVRWKD